MTYCVTGKGPCSCQPQEGVFCHYDKNIHTCHEIIFEQSKQIDSKDALIEEQAKQIEALRGFAQDVMEGWPESSGIDGGDLQEIAEKHELLKPETRTEPCGDNCMCADYGDFPVMCYRKTELLIGQ